MSRFLCQKFLLNGDADEIKELLSEIEILANSMEITSNGMLNFRKDKEEKNSFIISPINGLVNEISQVYEDQKNENLVIKSLGMRSSAFSGKELNYFKFNIKDRKYRIDLLDNTDPVDIIENTIKNGNLKLFIGTNRYRFHGDKPGMGAVIISSGNKRYEFLPSQ